MVHDCATVLRKPMNPAYRHSSGGAEGSLVGPGSNSSAHPSCVYQSLPRVSQGCSVRPEPLLQIRLFAGQYLSQPQQIRSGCLG